MSELQSQCDLPINLLDEEKVIRVIKTPYYFHSTRKNELVPKAFFPPPGKSDVWVVRHILGDDACVKQSRSTAKAEEYAGMLVVKSGTVRILGSTVYDHRHDYCGHAHINHGIVMPTKGGTLNPQDREILNARCKAIIALCKFHPDSHNAGEEWMGGPL